MRRSVTYSTSSDLVPRSTHRPSLSVHHMRVGDKTADTETEPRLGVIARLMVKFTKPFKKGTDTQHTEEEPVDSESVRILLTPGTPEVVESISAVAISPPSSPPIRKLMIDAPYTLADHPFVKQHPYPIKIRDPRPSTSSSIRIQG
ncbi:hypothetical protein CcaverHIS641_0401470 [Cutaneotrichosporon cavernicola]|nr:hypothetical protein CcaverHIS641_0401470 [Cutaneotrichosporon cavernicola]